MKKYILSIDQSTSASKAFLVDENGEIVRRASRPHQQYYPKDGWAEHDAEEINSFYRDWISFGLTRIDEWVSHQSTLRALLDDKWRATEYLDHWTGEGGEIL
jgi:glycerol kinase